MELFKALNKYRSSFSLQKSNLYKEVESHKQSILEEGFPYTNKNIDSIFILEVLYKGIANKQIIEDAYYTFVSHNFDIFEHITYHEKQKMINHDIQQVIQSLPSFKKGECNIFIPYLEDFINQRYIHDFQMITLKQHRDYINNYPRKIENICQLFGMKSYISNFSSLQFIGQDDSHYYFYFEENTTVYIFNENYEIQEEFSIVDQYHKYVPSLDEVKKIVQKVLETKEDQEVIDYMHEQGFLSAKGYKKISKKLG